MTPPATPEPWLDVTNAPGEAWRERVELCEAGRALSRHVLLALIQSGDAGPRVWASMVARFVPLSQIVPALTRSIRLRVDTGCSSHVVMDRWLRRRAQLEHRRALWYRRWSSMLDAPPDASLLEARHRELRPFMNELRAVAASGPLEAALAAVHVGLEWGLGESSRVVLDQELKLCGSGACDGRKAALWLNACTALMRPQAAEALALVREASGDGREPAAALRSATAVLNAFSLALDRCLDELIAFGELEPWHRRAG